MRESGVRKKVVEALKDLDAMSVENHVRPGTPDVNYREGWIELKYVQSWPARGGPLKIAHFSPEQRVWLTRRWRNGGMAHLLVRVGNDWLLFDGDVAAQHVGRDADKERLFDLAAFYCRDRLNEKALAEHLRAGRVL